MVGRRSLRELVPPYVLRASMNQACRLLTDAHRRLVERKSKGDSNPEYEKEYAATDKCDTGPGSPETYLEPPDLDPLVTGIPVPHTSGNPQDASCHRDHTYEQIRKIHTDGSSQASARDTAFCQR